MTVQATLEASMTLLDLFSQSRCQVEDRFPQTQSSAQSVSKLYCSLIPLSRTLDYARKGTTPYVSDRLCPVCVSFE